MDPDDANDQRSETSDSNLSIVSNVSSSDGIAPPSDEENETTSFSSRVNFDPTIPIQHSYLGDSLEEYRGRTILDTGIHVALPLMVQPTLVLLPGQILPITTYFSENIRMFHRVINNNGTFGVVSVFNANNYPMDQTNFSIGTTAEIYEYQNRNNQLNVKAIGRQRFKILRYRQDRDCYIADVEVLKEIEPPKFLKQINLNGSKRLKSTNDSLFKKKSNFKKVEALMTHWPGWVYDQYEPRLLVDKISTKMHQRNMGQINRKLDGNLQDLSFYIAQNLPLSEDQRIFLLQINCSTQRLRWELSMLEKFSQKIICHECGLVVTHQKHIFSMSTEGPQGTYVNPSGHLHDVITVSHVNRLSTHANEPCTEYSWFPGYGWNIVECQRCRKHIGWKFTAMSSKLKPQKFWGLTRSSVTIVFQSDDEEATFTV